MIEYEIPPRGGILFCHSLLHSGMPNMEALTLYAAFLHLDYIGTGDHVKPGDLGYEESLPVRVELSQVFSRANTKKRSKSKKRARDKDERSEEELIAEAKKWGCASLLGSDYSCADIHPDNNLRYRPLR